MLTMQPCITKLKIKLVGYPPNKPLERRCTGSINSSREKSLSKTHHRASYTVERLCMSSLSTRCSITFRASHSGRQLQAVCACIILLTCKQRLTLSLQYKNQYGIRECDCDLAWVWNSTISAKSFLSRQIKKGSAGKVLSTKQSSNLTRWLSRALCNFLKHCYSKKWWTIPGYQIIPLYHEVDNVTTSPLLDFVPSHWSSSIWQKWLRLVCEKTYCH